MREVNVTTEPIPCKGECGRLARAGTRDAFKLCAGFLVALGEEPDGVDALSHAGPLGALGVQRGGISARNVSSVLRDVLTKMVLVAYVPSTNHVQNCFLLD